MSAFPSTAELLTQGEDPRLCLDPHRGINHYLCRPQPDADLLKLGSSTASTISQCSFEIADRMRNQMAEACRYRQPEEVYQEQSGRICQALRDCLQLNEKTLIELTESGTDAHRLAVCRVHGLDAQRPLRVLMIEASETGSGVPDALCAPAVHAPINGSAGGGVRCSEIALRDADAMPLPAALIDAAVFAQAEQAIRRGEAVLLVMVDQSKSGCVAPSLSCGLDLRQRYPGQIHLLLDGCQFRFSCRTLKCYLAHGIMVALTGSKFLAGPSFSGALLLPDGEPVSAEMLPKQMNPGLLIRWQVALASLQHFSMLDSYAVRAFLKLCGQAVQQRMIDDPALESLATPAIERAIERRIDRTIDRVNDRGIDRGNASVEASWDDLPTIFPFRLRLLSDKATPACASYADAMTIYRQLQLGDAPRIQLGRPILAGRNNGEANGALRLCIGAPMLIDAIAHQQQQAVIAQCMLGLDRVSAALV